MVFDIVCGKAQDHSTEAIVVNLFEGVTVPGGATGAVDRALDGAISALIEGGDATGKLGQTTVLYPPPGRISARRVVIVGLGKQAEFCIERVRHVASSAAKCLRDSNVKQFSTIVHGAGIAGLSPSDCAQAVVEGGRLGLYGFNDYRTARREEIKTVERITILEADAGKISAIEEGVRIGTVVADGTILARDLSNEPGNTLTPTGLADRARSVAATEGLAIEVLGPEQIRAEGMGGLMGVAQGSSQPAQFIVLEYSGAGGKPVVLIGKGLTFDSGGISIKPAEKMEEMKHDMSGAAAVIGTMQTVSRLKFPVHLVGLIPATENLPGGSALKPGDIVKTMSGQTIEVINTDAEGRLVLADALTYAARYEPVLVVDLATLTGACVVALGSEATGLLTNAQTMVEKFVVSGERVHERVWQLPLFEEYDELIKSEIADVKNSGGRWGGAITAAALLKKFAGDSPWVHLDIAGTAWTDKERPYAPKGATGVGVRLLTDFLSSWS